MENKNLKKLSEFSLNEVYNIRHYAKDGRVKLIKTENGLMFDEEEYKLAKKQNKSLNLDNINYINNENMRKCLYTKITGNSNAEYKARHLLQQKKIKKYYNTDNSKLYCKTTELLQKEITEISKYTNIEEEKIIEFILKETGFRK